MGLGVAEAMDTAQRGMGLDWGGRELIALSAAAARISNGRLACGAGTDELAPGSHPLEAIADAYLEQCAHIEGHGAR